MAGLEHVTWDREQKRDVYVAASGRSLGEVLDEEAVESEQPAEPPEVRAERLRVVLSVCGGMPYLDPREQPPMLSPADVAGCRQPPTTT